VIARLLSLAALLAVAPASVAQEAAPPSSGNEAPSSKEPAPPEPKRASPAVFDAFVVASYPHDATAFTQGLLWHEGWLYESTGRIGTSNVRKVDLTTGKVAMNQPIPYPQFGEGLALWDDELISLTWRNGVINRWKLDDLSPVSSHKTYPFEGWGLARLNDQLVASDGTATLRFLDPVDYAIQRELTVTLNGRPLARLNELEVVNGVILANVWKTNFIVIINPGDGVVRAIIDCRGLPQPEGDDPEAVLNGIAWDPEGERLLVTGKLWPQLHEIELRRRTPVRPEN
jgi:glutaminyl-peptide cyclotransferase